MYTKKQNKGTKRLYIDCQILQTAAFDRGMGKYSTSLLKALMTLDAENNYYSKVVILLNKNLETSEERIRAIKDLTACDKVSLLDLPVDISSGLDEKNKVARHKIDEFLSNEGIEPGHTDFLMMAPFFVGFCSVFPNTAGITKYSLVYDITPQKIERIQKIFPDDIYYSHYRIFFEADHLFTISDAVKNDLENFIGIAPSKMTNIDGGPFMSLAKLTVGEVKYKQPYVHLPSGPMVHKNNERAVRAFEKFNRRQGKKFTLYITSSFDEDTKRKLSSLSNSIVFTGNVSDDEMHAAFKGAQVVLFPSLAEGLGMPVLEASYYDTPVACSDIPVLSELSKDGFYLFDPNSVDSIASAIEGAAKRQDWTKHSAALDRLRKKYTWRRSAAILLDELSKPHSASPAGSIEELLLNYDANNSSVRQLSEHVYARLMTQMPIRIQLTVSGNQLAEKPARYFMNSSKGTAGSRSVLEIMPIKLGLRGLLSRKKRLVVLLDKKPILRLEATPTIMDRALRISGWQYADENGKTVTGAKIADIINSWLH